MNKILYIATSDVHLATFHTPYLKWLGENGVQVDIVVENRGNLEFEGVNNTYHLDFPRSFTKKELLVSYKKLKNIIDNGNYNIIHCHTPIPSMLTRLAASKARANGAKVLYTAHGFHFYKGAPASRWLVYYSAEYILSKFTDAIITINKEDYGYVNNKMLHKDSYHIKGIGVDSSRFKPLNKEEKREKRIELGLDPDKFVLLYVAEFISRKNHEFVIRSIQSLQKTIPNLQVLFAGKGELLDKMKQLSKELEVDSSIKFLGFRKDVHLLSAIADIGISSSKHEGLGLGLTEEMFCKVPIIASYDRGHKEMVVQGENGYMFQQGNSEEFIGYVNTLYQDEELRLKMGEKAYEKAQEFEIENSLNSMKEIYKRYLIS
ncbi:glycosyltransferase family 4 protein [Faecalibacter macacae]|uniref:Glycosyltransferase family 1 protein n=1 Tax=Faecalibacter macacae TaxID=1859289 RepID=A0A3L9MBW7_9FLAO|nr:glycosyltransferase family 4 protein [Faecalibacter macacae]RLZ10545.1 glycosyltransferase family 1 protein [Faecalibacter macacae]